MKKLFFRIFGISRNQIFAVFLALFGFVAFVPVFTYIYFANDLTSKEAIMNKNNTGVILTDKDGTPFYSFFRASNKTFVPIEEIPAIVKNAIIAVEDKDFYTHPGFSIKSMIGALIADFKKRDLAYGGSTITQQLVKNALLSSNKSFLRKYQELILAQEVERRYTKDEILEMYLNSVYFGEGAFGVEEAAEKYFNKKSKELNLSEAAILASLLPSPSSFSPLSNDKQAALDRQKYVLKSMQDEGYITQEERINAEKEVVVFKSPDQEINTLGTHFALMVLDELSKIYGEEKISRSGFKVKTTLDLGWQKVAEETVKEQVELLKRNKVSNGAAVAIDADSGEVRVLVGSKDWYDNEVGKINLAAAPRQPGSSFKPIIYGYALEKKIINTGTVLKDEKRNFQITKYDQPYTPKNYDGRFRGDVLPRRALANSLNIPAVEVMSKVGVEETIKVSKELGITTLNDPKNYGLSLVLGAGEVPLVEMTNAYAAFANEGMSNKITLILEIKDKVGEVVYENKKVSNRVFSPETSFLISSILSDNNARAEIFGNSLTVPITAAVKTGTTEDYKDAWTIGYTPDIAVGVWVGNNDNTQMDNIAGSLGAAPIWKILIQEFSKGKVAKSFIPPEGMVEVNICRNNGLRLRESSNLGYREYFIKGNEPDRFCVIPAINPTTANKKSPTLLTNDKDSDKKDEKKEEKKKD